jgi:RNA polymerase sigma factor (sigma-70 family)
MKSDDEMRDAEPPPSAVAEAGDWLLHRLPDWPRIWGACLRRTRSWPIPPRWTAWDWREEIDAEGIAAACNAIRNFDPSRGPTLGSYVYHQILSGALARYRQEWSYALRCSPAPFSQDRATEDPAPLPATEETERLKTTISSLVEQDRRLIERLFWDGWTEAQVAGSLGITQQAVSKRKRKILLELRRRFGSSDEV